MSSAAQKEETLEDVGYESGYAATGTESAAKLKEIASEKLEAHRRRRAGFRPESEFALESEPVPAPRRTSKVREAVAARYQNSVTYREFLAQEAERALEKAHAEAEVALRNAQAVAQEQMRLLEELQQWNDADPSPREIALAERQAEMRHALADAVAEIGVAATEMMEQQPLVGMSPVGEAAVRAFHADELTVRMYDDFGGARPVIEHSRHSAGPIEADEQETSALDEEIAFRRAPEFEQQTPHVVGIPGNLIEFPRQLVAARKVRPRLAEGPLREEVAPEPQLRIFEVEAEQISAAPAEPTSAPEWQGILLENLPMPKPLPEVEEQLHYAMQPQTARLELRLMAAVVDACCVGVALLGFATVAVELAGPNLKTLPLPMVGICVGVVAAFLFVAYQMLFFTFGEATPGMRYARIGLCTFADSNPTRPAMRRRVFAMLLAAVPLGLGLAWAWMDEESLGWHDRISRMYQRAY